ncbi:ATP-binding response regulator [Halobacterium wangiae]|uniref:ATP-binding response regulator n=1 Tax=Halobacterium wangiae TaxID=2902623 RepID=UPI001E491DF0|nr:response regulator [Halobacterium wangiae]
MDDQILVLHIDDDEQTSELTAEFLERISDSFNVRTETNPREVLGQLSAEPIDCVISDYQMPEMDGIKLLSAVREEYPNLPFILFTGKGSEEVASEAIDAGVTSYVQKGGTEVYDQLANSIQNAVSRRRSERRARIAQDRLLALYEQTDGFYILNSEWRIIYWNQTIANRTGLSADDALNETFWDVFPDATETETYDCFQNAMAAGDPTEFETYYEPLGYWAEVRAYPVEDGLFVHSRDITQNREREQEMERRNHILESFANTVSHDLRNPLNVAEGKLQLAQETGDFEHLDEVAKAHNRMRNLIDELLRLARGEELALTVVSIGEIAEQAWETVSSESTELIVDADAEIRAHESQLQRLFENLFWNAIDHGNASTIRVGLLDDGAFIEDDGPGIPPTERKTVFESGYSTDEGSPGYGLSIVKGIAENHNWEIKITESDEGGARFELTGIDR